MSMMNEASVSTTDLAAVVKFDPDKDRLLELDFTEANTSLTAGMVENMDRFSAYVDAQRKAAGAKFGIGGYGEHRTVYSRSRVFDPVVPDDEPRRLHLGIDIWGEAGTEVFAPLDGIVHSFAFNDSYGDYGATIILFHRIGDLTLHSLYGHLSLKNLEGLTEGIHIKAGTLLAHFGEPAENGHWPPHLHFQLIEDMEGRKGDYPGVCKYSERDRYLSNCPNPDILLKMMTYAIKC